LFQESDTGRPGGRRTLVKVALAGNPNSGKSSLFNILTGLHQKIANFPGVTVEQKTGQCTIYNSTTGEPTSFEIIDLPGIYSLYPKSPDERIPFEILCDPGHPSHPDLVIVLADGTNLKRSLFLASQVIDLKIPTVIALNMIDLVRKDGIDINLEELERRLGVRIIPINARKSEGIEELKQALLFRFFPPEKDIFETLHLMPRPLKNVMELTGVRSPYAALQIMQHADALPGFSFSAAVREQTSALIAPAQGELDKLKSFETVERYKVIQELLLTAVTKKDAPSGSRSISQRIDTVLMVFFSKRSRKRCMSSLT